MNCVSSTTTKRHRQSCSTAYNIPNQCTPLPSYVSTGALDEQKFLFYVQASACHSAGFSICFYELLVSFHVPSVFTSAGISVEHFAFTSDTSELANQ